MKPGWRALDEALLVALAEVLEEGRVGPPWRVDFLTQAVGGPAWVSEAIAAEIQRGLTPQGLAFGLRLLAEEKAHGRHQRDRVELTWTGPEEVVTDARDTGAVARSLFASAQEEIWISTYVLDSGEKAHNLLGVLQERWRVVPGLRVKLFLNLGRSLGDPRPPEVLVEAHREWFWSRVWPGQPRPEVYYDRRALELTTGPRACLHAKCIIVDAAYTLMTSANLTQAAQERNIEAGVLVHDPRFAQQVKAQFEHLLAHQILVRLD